MLAFQSSITAVSSPSLLPKCWSIDAGLTSTRAAICRSEPPAYPLSANTREAASTICARVFAPLRYGPRRGAAPSPAISEAMAMLTQPASTRTLAPDANTRL